MNKKTKARKKLASDKGAAFERRIAREIGLWWCDDKDAFWRTSGSGARAKRDSIHPGDIAPVKQLKGYFPFCIECRDRQRWSLIELLKAPAPALLLWMVQNSIAAGDDFLSLLIVHKKYQPVLAVYPHWFAYGEASSLNPCNSLTFATEQEPLIHIVSLQSLFHWFKPEQLQKLRPGSVPFWHMKDTELAAITGIIDRFPAIGDKVSVRGREASNG